jgi:hypothetical protein
MKPVQRRIDEILAVLFLIAIAVMLILLAILAVMR